MFRKLLKLLSQKAGITAFSLILQFAFVVFAAIYAASYFWWLYIVLYVLSIIICLYIISRDMNPAYKLSWCVFILVMPITGGLMYLFLGRHHTPRRTLKKLKKVADSSQVLLNLTNAQILSERATLNPTGHSCADLVLNSASYPVFDNTKTKYYPLGDDFFPDLIADLRSAREFVFLEYFIIEPGEIWSEIEPVLLDRAAHGVDVRLIYDDVGSMFTLPKKTIKKLQNGGVKCLPFNKITLSFDMRLNNRSHRKIAVIDGHTAYTGGCNIADEYANKTVRFGHWKDTNMRFYGEAVCGFTTMFLSFWNILSKDSDEYADYFRKPDAIATGHVQPVSSAPFGRNSQVLENAFINLISTSKRYVYIMTPYLILDNETQTALVNAAKSGVDVRIVIPHIPDKKAVYMTTKSFIPPLVKAGVRVYTYTPGFVHAKMIITDDERAFIGTCNMDYRSFYLHYECGALLYNTDTIPEMKSDFLATLDDSHEVAYEEIKDYTVFTRLGYSVLRLIAPLM